MHSRPPSLPVQRNKSVREKLVYLNLADNGLQFTSCKVLGAMTR